MIRRHAGFAQTNRHDGGVPDGREARLDAQVAGLVVLEPLEFPQCAHDLRMIAGVAERLERDQRIQHRREDRRQTVRMLEALQHPRFALLQRAFAEGMDAGRRPQLGKLVQFVELQEEVAPGEPLRITRQGQVALVETVRVQFSQIEADRPGGFEVVDDRQRHKHRARPVAHVPEIHVKPLADEQHFTGDCGDILPRIQINQREVELREGVHPRYPAEAAGHRPRLEHPGVGDRDAAKFEREIALDGRVHLRRPAGVNIPAAVRQLSVEQVLDGLPFPCRIDAAIPVMKNHHVRDEGRIDHQLTHPVTGGLLEVEEVLLRAFERQRRIRRAAQSEFPLPGGRHRPGSRWIMTDQYAVCFAEDPPLCKGIFPAAAAPVA